MISYTYFNFTIESETRRIIKNSFLPVVTTRRQLFHFLQLLDGFEAQKMKQLALGTVILYDNKVNNLARDY